MKSLMSQFKQRMRQSAWRVKQLLVSLIRLEQHMNVPESTVSYWHIYYYNNSKYLKALSDTVRPESQTSVSL